MALIEPYRGGDDMGAKFANLHIQTTDRQIVIDALQRLTDQAGDVLAKPILRDTNIIDEYIYRKESGNRIRETEPHVTYYLHQSSEWTTVLNCFFEWGTVEQVGDLLSAFLVEPVMTVGFFDENLFEWTIFQDGEVRCRKYFCGSWGADEYEFKPEIIDFAYLQEVIEIKRANLDRLFDSETPGQAVDLLSELLDVHLRIDSKVMDGDSESAKKHSGIDQDIRK